MFSKKNLFRMICVSMVCGLLSASYPMSSYAAEIDTLKPSGREVCSLANFNAVDELMERRLDALGEGDMEQYHTLSRELKKHGCEDISAREVQQLTGESPESLFQSKGQLIKGEPVNVEFSKVIKEVSYEGEKYKVLKITAFPTELGTLYRTGSAVHRYSDSIKPKDLDILKITVNLGGKNRVVKKVTMYDAAKKLLKRLKIKKFEGDFVTYLWSIEEICSFIFVYDAREESYSIAANYNKAKHIVSMMIPYAKEKNGKYYHNIIQKKYSGWVFANHYGSTQKAIQSFRRGKVYHSWVNCIQIRGCKGKKIRDISLWRADGVNGF